MQHYVKQRVNKGGSDCQREGQEGTETLLQAALSADPLINTLQQDEVVNVNAYSETISNAISKAASKCMIKVGCARKNKNKKWFNHSCNVLRTEVKKLSKSLAQRPHDPLVRQMFNRIKREYKEALKRARQEFRSQLTESLENFSNDNSKMYWKILDQLKI